METALKLARAGDGIVLVQDAVFALRSPSRECRIEDASRKGLRLYALKADMDARSVKATPAVETIDYDRLVELLIQYERTFS